jgi:hypothetical protein
MLVGEANDIDTTKSVDDDDPPGRAPTEEERLAASAKLPGAIRRGPKKFSRAYGRKIAGAWAGGSLDGDQ